MAELTKEIREQLKAKHPDAIVINRGRFGDFVFEPPNRSKWRAYRHRTKDETREDQREKLAEECLVWPEKTKDEPDTDLLDDMFDRYPATADMLFMLFQQAAGGTQDQAGKL